MKIITVANQKGGAGKSTTAASLSAEFALRGYRTLLVTADPQVNASKFFIAAEDVERGLEEVMVKPAGNKRPGPLLSITDITIPTAIPNLALAPSTSALTGFDRESNLSISRLKVALDAVDELYDFCFVDTPPVLGMLLSAAIVACDYVLIPCPCEPMALDGLGALLSTIEEARGINPDIRIAGVCLTMVDRRYSIGAAIRETLRAEFSEHTFETVVHRQVKLMECSTANQPVQLYAPRSSGAQDYHGLADELLIHLGYGAAPGAAVVGHAAEASAAASSRV